MMNFKTCCCRYTLKTGSIIIAIVTAASSLAALVAWLALCYATLVRSWGDGQRWAESARLAGFPENEVQSALEEDFGSLSFITYSTRVLLNMLAAIEAFNVNFSLMLLYGVCKGKVSYMRLWVRSSVNILALRFVLMLPIIIQALIADFFVLGATALLFATLSIPLAVYFILVVNSYHTKMMSDKLLKAYCDWANMK